MDRETAEPTIEEFPGPNARKWIDFHSAHATPSEHSHEFVWDTAAEADGPFVTDVDGNVFLDFTCHIGAAPLGYNNEKTLSKLREFDLLEPMKIAGQDLYFGAGPDPDTAEFPGSSHLMARLTDITSHYDMDAVFLSNSGAEAVENAMKAAYDHAPAAKYGVAFLGSFHGRTLGTLSLTKSKEVYTRHYPQIAGIETIPFCTKRDCSTATCECGFFAQGDSMFRNVLTPEGGHLDPEEIAFAVLEPIQGVGGYRFPSETFMAEIGDVCSTHDIALIADEIQSGVGRTGEMWAADHYPIEPDIIAGAKGLRVGATVSRAELFPSDKNRLGSTFGGGDVLGAMQGTFTLEAIERYDLLDNATERGEQAKELLRDDAADCVEDVRGKGLMLAVEFDSAEHRNDTTTAALKRGMITLGCGEKTIRLLPPLDATEREINLGIGILCEAIDVAASKTPA
jgi:4-aminobutyrate aminotransferase